VLCTVSVLGLYTVSDSKLLTTRATKLLPPQYSLTHFNTFLVASGLSDHLYHTPAAMSAAAAVPQIAKAANLWTEWNDTHVCMIGTQFPGWSPVGSQCNPTMHSVPWPAGGVLPSAELCYQHLGAT
jgi:hypothetical protein